MSPATRDHPVYNLDTVFIMAAGETSIMVNVLRVEFSNGCMRKSFVLCEPYQ